MSKLTTVSQPMQRLPINISRISFLGKEEDKFRLHIQE